MKESKKKNKIETDQEKTTGATSGPGPVSDRDSTPEVLTDLETNIFCLVDDYIKTLPDPDMLTEYDAVFVGLLKYIYKYYLQYILKNNTDGFYKCGSRYDYKVLDEIFNIYIKLVYTYKHNKQCYINEFCIFLNIDRDTLYNIKQGISVKASPQDIQNVKRWYSECEQSLLNGSGVAEIFKLKSMFRYNDNLAPLPVEYQTTGLSVADLPKLGQKDNKKLLSDHQKDPKKDV